MFEINQNLLPLKIHYGIFNAGVVPMLAYGSVYAKQAGLSAITVGCMWTILLIASVCLKITLSGIADRYGKRRLIFFSSVLACAFSAFLLSFVPIPNVGRSVTLLCSNLTYFRSCHDYFNDITLNRMKKKNPQGSVTCQLNCDPDNSKFAHEVCMFWQHRNECEPMIFPEDIQFDASMKNKHIFLMPSDKKCLYGLLNEVVFANAPQTKYPPPQCREDTEVNCTMKCDSNELMNELKLEDPPLMNDFKHFITWVLFALFLCYMCSLSLNFSLTDTICFELLGDRPQLYGQQRLFGSIGFGAMTLLGGWLIDKFSRDTFDKNYGPLFMSAAIILCADIFLTFKIKIEQNVKSSSVVKDVSMIFYSIRIVIFAFWCFLMGMFCGQCWEFLFWHLEDMSTIDDLQWIRSLQGLATLLNTIVGEIPVFFLSGWVIKKLGPYNCMSLILFSSALRFVGYSIITRPVWVLPIELLSGFIFGMSYVIIASYSSFIALPGTESTVQAVFSATFEGLGMAGGSLLGGMIYNAYDGYALFRSMSIVALIATIVHVLIHLKLPVIPDQRVHKAKNATATYTSPTGAISKLNSTSL